MAGSVPPRLSNRARPEKSISTTPSPGAGLSTDELLVRFENLHLAAQAAGVGVWEIDVAADTVRGTSTFFQLMGLPDSDRPVPMNVLRALRLPGDREEVNQGYADAVRTGVDTYSSEYRIRRPDGEVRWILGRGRVVRDAAGKPIRFSGCDIDITERKANEQAFAESEARLQMAIEAADLGIWDWDLVTNELTWSDRAKEISGFDRDAPLTFDQVRDATHPGDLPRTQEMSRRALDPAVRASDAYEYRIVRPDGSVRWVLAHGAARFARVDGAEKAIRYTGTIQDITARREADLRRREAEARLRLAVDAARLAVWEYNSISGAVQDSRELRRLLGFPEDKPLDLKLVAERYLPGEQEKISAAGQEALRKGERFVEVEYRFYWPDRSIRWLLLRAEIRFAEDDKTVTGAIGVVLDITEQKEAEQHRQLLLHEMQHRVNNTLALVSAIAHQTFSSTQERTEALAAFSARLGALGRAHSVLTRQQWRSAAMADVVDAALAPFAADGRVAAAGPAVELSSRRVLAILLALNELATNAAKYGALSTPDGRVTVTWRTEGEGDGASLRFEWAESGGPPVTQPTRTGFGSRMIREMLANDFGATASVVYAPTGVVFSFTAPLT